MTKAPAGLGIHWHVSSQRVGETSEVLSHSQHLKELNLPFSMTVYINGSRARDAKAFLHEVAKALQTKNEIGSSLDVDDLDGLFEYIEGALAEGTTESGIPLLLMDEVENLARPEFSDVLNWLRAVASSNSLNMVTASKSALSQVFAEGDLSGFWNIFQQVRLGLMEPDEVKEMLSQLATPEFEGTVGEQVLQEAGCHPFFVQQFAWHCYEAWNPGTTLKSEQWPGMLERFEAAIIQHFDYIFKQLSPAARETLLEKFDTEINPPDVRKGVRDELLNQCVITSEGKIFGESFRRFLRSKLEEKDTAQTPDVAAVKPEGEISERGRRILRYLTREGAVPESRMGVELRLLPTALEQEIILLQGQGLVESSDFSMGLPVYRLTGKGESTAKTL